MIIPPDQLSQQALLGVLDNFILREGTAYGRHEVSHEQKQEHLLNQIQNGQVVIVFDPEDQSITLRNKDDVLGET